MARKAASTAPINNPTTVNAVSADALDDDFELDDGLVAPSGEESDDIPSEPQPRKSNLAKPRQQRPLDVEDEDEFIADDDEGEEGDHAESMQDEEDEYGLPVNKKRKLDPSTASGSTGKQASQQPLTAEEKKKKRKEKSKAAKRKKLDAIDLAESENATSLIAVQPPSLQADYLAEMQIQAMPKMSGIEMEDFRIAETYLLDTSTIEDRTSLNTFITASTKLKPDDLKAEKATKPGSPKLLVVSGAALRVADVVRELRELSGKTEVAKLFAKHFKLAEHCTYCEKTKFSIGAGTPDRILKLIEASALSLDEMTHLVIDMKKDSKKRHILDIPESRTALFKLLNTEKVNERLKSGKMKLVLF